MVCIPRILVGVNLEVGVTSLMKRILEACNWKLTACEEGYAVSNEEELLQTLTFLLMMMEMAVIGPSRGLLPVSLSLVMRITTMSANARARLARA